MSVIADLADENDVVQFNTFESETAFGSRLIYSYFDSWCQAVIKAGYTPGRSANGTYESIYYGKDWDSVASQVRDRSHHRCRICRETAGSNTSLQVHHITPARTFIDSESLGHEEMNAKTNLISLCPSCHQTVEGLWQDLSPKKFAEIARATYPERVPPALPSPR